MKSTTKRIAILGLTVDPNVQRLEGIDHTRVATMAAAFDPMKLGTIKVSQRPDGQNIVLDGMHRTEVCRVAGYTGLVNAEVFTGMTREQEFEMALGWNNNKLVTALTRFHWRVGMGEPEAVEISRIADDHGWKIAQSSNPGCISAIHALERVYRNGGGTVPEGRHPELLDRVLSILTVAWEWDNKSVDAGLTLGLAQLIGRCGVDVDDKKIIGEMQDTRPGVLVGRGKALREAQGGSLPAAIAKILVGMHNARRRTNLLPEWVWVR